MIASHLHKGISQLRSISQNGICTLLTYYCYLYCFCISVISDNYCYSSKKWPASHIRNGIVSNNCNIVSGLLFGTQEKSRPTIQSRSLLSLKYNLDVLRFSINTTYTNIGVLSELEQAILTIVSFL